jgi:hypothetical protein
MEAWHTDEMEGEDAGEMEGDDAGDGAVGGTKLRFTPKNMTGRGICADAGRAPLPHSHTIGKPASRRCNTCPIELLA